MLRGFGSLIGEFIPFFVALAIMLSASVKLTLILLCLIPVVWVVTFIFKGATREIFRGFEIAFYPCQRLQRAFQAFKSFS